MRIESVEQLRTHYQPARERSLRKQLTRLDAHCRRFIALSPFLVIASRGGDGLADASPRGDQPGFVRVIDDVTLAIPDWPGNNRLDTLTNILAEPEIGLLFLVPGVDETLRVNGRAELVDDARLCNLFVRRGGPAKLVVRVAVREAYLHCAKALMRAKLWSAEAQVDRATLPSMGEMLRDQLATADKAETQAEMLERYRQTLY